MGKVASGWVGHGCTRNGCTHSFAFTLVPLMSVVSIGLLFWGGEYVVLKRSVYSGAMFSCVDSAVHRGFQNKPKMYY